MVDAPPKIAEHYTCDFSVKVFPRFLAKLYNLLR